VPTFQVVEVNGVVLALLNLVLVRHEVLQHEVADEVGQAQQRHA
jgi:hypothetical protein